MRNPELYFLRLLLLHVNDAVSYGTLKNVNGHQCDTFQEACKIKGLIADEKVWEDTLNEAVLLKMPKELRDLFAMICLLACPSNIKELWEMFKNDMSEDYSHRHVGHEDNCVQCENLVLRDLEEVFETEHKTCKHFGLRDPPSNIPANSTDYFDAAAEELNGADLVGTLNVEQRAAFDAIMSAIDDDTPQSRLFFLDGPGGSGKTHKSR
jgi:hypothetical protein